MVSKLMSVHSFPIGEPFSGSLMEDFMAESMELLKSAPQEGLTMDEKKDALINALTQTAKLDGKAAELLRKLLDMTLKIPPEQDGK